MSYERIGFAQYFIDQSLGQGGTTPSVEVKYKEIEFYYKRRKRNVFYCVMYNADRDVFQIYFKETCTKEQWMSNFNFPSKYYDSFEVDGKVIQLKVAGGWGVLYSNLKWHVRDELAALIDIYGMRELEIIGWSLGSAMAQLCAQDVYYNFGLKGYVYTYGSVKPWFGFSRRMRAYLRSCYISCYNFGDHNDIVSYMVPLPGYFKMRKVKLKRDSFCIAKLFNPKVYHTEYWREEYYTNID